MPLPVLSLLAATALGAIQFAPPCPTPSDAVALRVTRTFTEDCLWEVEPTVRREGGAIEVALSLRGQPGCDQAVTTKEFEVDLGKLPAGTYEVILRWSDSQAAERARLQVADGACAAIRNEDETCTHAG